MRLYEDQLGGTVAHARQLRRDAPGPERRLLQDLREAFPHLKWRHQVPVGPYFADVLCLSERLAAEVDGDTHAHSEAHDERRSHFLQNKGHRLIRITNTDVTENLNGVLARISLSLREREGAPQARKGGGDRAGAGRVPSPSPSHAATRRGPLPLPSGEEN